MTDNQPPERYELEQLLSRDQLEIPGKQVAKNFTISIKNF